MRAPLSRSRPASSVRLPASREPSACRRPRPARRACARLRASPASWPTRRSACPSASGRRRGSRAAGASWRSGERARIQAAGLRARLADSRIGGAHDHHPRDVAFKDPRDLPRAARHLERHPILWVKARAKQLQLFWCRVDPTCRAHLTILRDRDLTEIAVHVQPNRSTDRSHLVLLLVVELTEKQRANDNDRYVLTAHPGKSQGRPTENARARSPSSTNGLPCRVLPESP